MAATTNLSRTYRGDGEKLLTIPVKGSAIIYVGAAVSVEAASGLLRALNVADGFAGFAEEFVDMTGLSDGTRMCKVRVRGEILLTIAGTLLITDFAGAIYATDSDTFKRTSTSALQIGRLSQFVSASKGWVMFEGAVARSV